MANESVPALAQRMIWITVRAGQLADAPCPALTAGTFSS
jgi:hypothetical protein